MSTVTHVHTTLSTPLPGLVTCVVYQHNDLSHTTHLWLATVRVGETLFVNKCGEGFPHVLQCYTAVEASGISETLEKVSVSTTFA